jgi:hypothetical protein
MSPFAVVMLAAAVVLIVAIEWPRLSRTIGIDGRRIRKRAKRKSQLKVVSSDQDDDFVRAVERDLAALPTIDENVRKKP